MSEDDKGSVGVGGAGAGAGTLKLKLSDIIKERNMTHKAKRKLDAGQKRQADLQRIIDMKSATGIDPLQRFPKEIWAKLFEELDPADLGNCWEVHPLFRDLLKSIRIRDILFPQLLEIDAFQQYMKHISSSEFNQELRLISKSSRNSFDLCMENKLKKRIQDIEVPFEMYQDNLATFLHIGDDDALQMLKRVLASFKEGENPGKRFFLRGLTISFSEFHLEIDDEEERQERLEIRNGFQKDLTTFLERVGDQILRFRFFLCELKTTQFSLSEAYLLFHRWISLMPNLKWLEYCVDGSSETIQVQEESETSAAVKKDLMRKYPFPHLQFLERLTFNFYMCDGQMDIFQAVLEANQHVKFVEFVDGEDSDLEGLPSHLIKSLDLNSISVVHQDSDGRSLRFIEPLINLDWKLKTISLDLELEGQKIDSVFRFLERFPTLEKVHLSQLHGVLIKDGDTLGYLELPNLRSFYCHLHDPQIDYESNINFFLSLEFLLKCDKLENLIWNWNASGVDERKVRRHLKLHEKPGESIDFRAGLRFLYESNIWNVFPELRTVNVRAVRGSPDRFSRHGYCSHEYRRVREGERVTVSQFVSSHKCCRNDCLQDCVVLAE